MMHGVKTIKDQRDYLLSVVISIEVLARAGRINNSTALAIAQRALETIKPVPNGESRET